MRFISDDANDLKPAWMSSQEIKCPEKLLPVFWKHYTIADCRFFLWQMLSASMSTENQDVDASPGEQISFFENLVVYLEATFILDNGEPLSKAKRGESEQDETGESSSDIKPGGKLPKGNAPRKKLHKRLKRLSIWHRDGFDDPYAILDSFFDAYDLPSFKARLYDILHVCSQEKYYDKGCPADVLYFLEKAESIINAAYLILISEEAKWLDKSKTAMECIASCNAGPECEIEPAAVIFQCLKEFFEYKSLKKWKQELNRICLYSLSSQSAQEWGVWIDSLTLYKLICRLADTAFDLRKNRSTLP